MQPDQTFTTISADGTAIKLHRWNESGKENIFLLHGYVGHAQRFHALVQALLEKDYRITALDFRGHGQSEGGKGDIDMWIRYQEDILAAISTIRAPFFAIAQGSGGLALLTTMQGSITPTLKGVILSNPLLGLLRPPSVIQKVILRIGRRIPFVVRTAHHFRWEQLAFDVDVVESYQKDPLCFERTSLRFVQNTLCAQRSVMQHAQYYRTPLLLLISSNDSIAAPEEAEKFFSHYSGERIQKKYTQSAHLLLEDSEKREVCKDILQWLEKVR